MGAGVAAKPFLLSPRKRLSATKNYQNCFIKYKNEKIILRLYSGFPAKVLTPRPLPASLTIYI